MAAVILPFALTTVRQAGGPAPDLLPRLHGWMTLDLDGSLSPLRGGLPAATGSFAPALPRRRVPADAILAIGGRLRRNADVPPRADDAAAGAASAIRRMPRKHKLMLVTAAAVLWSGGMEARKHWKPRAVMIEEPQFKAHAIAMARF